VGFCSFKIADGTKQKRGAQQVQQEIHHCMIKDIILSNHGLRHEKKPKGNTN
jgi:hypothetical protein